MAKKGKISIVQAILTGILWSALYFGFIVPIIGWLLGFNFLSGVEWQNKYQAFVNYKWQVNTLFDTLLFFTMLLWIPFWLLGWWYVYRINWKKFKPAPRKKTVARKTFELRENRQIYHMPRKMPSTVQTTRYVAPKLPNQTEEVVSGAKSHTNLVQMIRSIATLAKKYQVEIFQHILLEGHRVPMAISTDARAVLIEIVNKKNVNWSVEFTDDVLQGSWYSEGGVMDKLAQDLMLASASLAKSEPNSEILSAIVVTDGRILNAKQAVEYFKSKGIFLIGFNNAEPKSDLPDLASFLSAYFDLKAGETDPAPHPVEKVPLKSKQSSGNVAEESKETNVSQKSGAEESAHEEDDEDLTEQASALDEADDAEDDAIPQDEADDDKIDDIYFVEDDENEAETETQEGNRLEGKDKDELSSKADKTISEAKSQVKTDDDVQKTVTELPKKVRAPMPSARVANPTAVAPDDKK